MKLEFYTALIDTLILLILIIWAWMDRTKLYLFDDNVRPDFEDSDNTDS